MSAASCLLSEDQFLCSICLDVFTDPVSTPCGHNFCKTCITQHWDISPLCQCPVCKRQYRTRPELHVNTFISEMSAQFKLSAQQEASRSSSSLRLGGRMCTEHNAPLEMFCKTDHTCVCVVCFALDHKMHSVVPLKEEYEVREAEFENVEDKIQPMIQERKIKIQEMKHSVELNKKAADREMAEGVQVFTALIESAKTDLNSLIRTIEEKQRTAKKRAEGFIKELEKEISELMKLSPGMEHQQSKDPFVHNFSSMKISPPTNKGPKVNVHPQTRVGDRLPSYDGMVVRAVNQLEETHRKQLRRLVEAELQRVRQYMVNVALDPDRVEPRSSQSVCKCVLSKQAFSSGRFYFEVSVKSHSSWTVGVATGHRPLYQTEIRLSPENGYWTISSGRGRLFSLFQSSKLEKVGVFVNYDDGLICFYDILGAALIHSSTCCAFTSNIHPFFSPCSNDGVQIHTSACVIS